MKSARRLAGSVDIIVDTVKDALDDTPPELVADLMESGICLAGGGGQLKGLAERLAEEVNIRAWVADDSMTLRGARRRPRPRRLQQPAPSAGRPGTR